MVVLSGEMASLPWRYFRDDERTITRIPSYRVLNLAWIVQCLPAVDTFNMTTVELRRDLFGSRPCFVAESGFI